MYLPRLILAPNIVRVEKVWGKGEGLKRWWGRGGGWRACKNKWKCGTNIKDLWELNPGYSYLWAFFIISSPPSRNDLMSLGMEDSPALISTTSPPSLVSTPTLCLPPSTNWTRRMLCLNRVTMDFLDNGAEERRIKLRNIKSRKCTEEIWKEKKSQKSRDCTGNTRPHAPWSLTI